MGTRPKDLLSLERTRLRENYYAGPSLPCNNNSCYYYYYFYYVLSTCYVLAPCKVIYMYYLYKPLEAYEIGINLSPILQVRRLRVREVNSLIQGPRA